MCMSDLNGTKAYSLFRSIDRATWKNLNGHLSYTPASHELNKLRGLNEPLTQTEIEEIYVPLSRLLQLHMEHYWRLHGEVDVFLRNRTKNLPFIIGIAGSVAAGKSTTARVLQKVLALTKKNLRVELITTDGFLHPNRVLTERGILNRKGFPESYRARELLSFLAAVKSGKKRIPAPVYSHFTYDILPDEVQWIDQPDVLIVEGINVLQVNLRARSRGPRVFVSDYFDFSIYVDASERHLKEWYIARFESLRQTAFQNPESYFHKYAELNQEESRRTALAIWNEINRPNLIKNILPTKYRSNLILEKGENHLVSGVKLRMT